MNKAQSVTPLGGVTRPHALCPPRRGRAPRTLEAWPSRAGAGAPVRRCPVVWPTVVTVSSRRAPPAAPTHILPDPGSLKSHV